MPVHDIEFEDIETIKAIADKLTDPEDKNSMYYILERWAYAVGYAKGVTQAAEMLLKKN